MAAKINRTGKTYGDLTVLETIPGSNSKADTYLVKCNCCGNTMIIGIDALLKGLKCKDCRGKDRKRTYQDLVGKNTTVSKLFLWQKMRLEARGIETFVITVCVAAEKSLLLIALLCCGEK